MNNCPGDLPVGRTRCRAGRAPRTPARSARRAGRRPACAGPGAADSRVRPSRASTSATIGAAPSRAAIARASLAAAAALSRCSASTWHSAGRSRQYASSRGRCSRARHRSTAAVQSSAVAGPAGPRELVARRCGGARRWSTSSSAGGASPSSSAASRSTRASASDPRRAGSGPAPVGLVAQPDHQQLGAEPTCPACPPAGAAPSSTVR